MPIRVFSAYAPTAQAKDQVKTQFYRTLTNAVRRQQGKYMTLTLGDFNARVQAKLSDDEEGIGIHTFENNNTTFGQMTDPVFTWGTLRT